MKDKEQIQIKSDTLVASLETSGTNIQEQIEKFIAYLQTYCDQRKKPSDSHGLDIWAHKALGLERKEYTDEERKLLRAQFHDVTQKVLAKTKTLLASLVTQDNTAYIKHLLSRPLKDEIKTFCCEIISQKRIAGIEESIITLYLKGTQKVSLAAFGCMKQAKNIVYYFPIKRLSPARLKLSADDKTAFLKELKREHSLIEVLENDGASEKLQQYVQDPNIVADMGHVVIALSYRKQKQLYAHIKENISEDIFILLGQELENKYAGITKPKSREYLSYLKKAIADSLLIGGWIVSEETEKILNRNLVQQADYDYLGSILEALAVRYRTKYFTAVLNPSKHIKGEKGKAKLFWVYHQIQTSFQHDYKQLERHIKWHLGNEDDVRIETLITIANLDDTPAEEIVTELQQVSQDDRFSEYHDRINSVLPDEALLLTNDELKTLSNEALKSKVDTILEKREDDILKKNVFVLCEYLEGVDDKRFELVIHQAHRILDTLATQSKPSPEKDLYASFKKILKTDASRATVRRRLILDHLPFLTYLRGGYPSSFKSVEDDDRNELLGNIILKEPDVCGAVRTAAELLGTTDKHTKHILFPLTKRIVSDQFSLLEIKDAFSEEERRVVVAHFLNFLSVLKSSRNKVIKESKRETARMKSVIVEEITPKLNKAKQRAGDQEILTESYEEIITALTAYAKQSPVVNDKGVSQPDLTQLRDDPKAVTQDAETIQNGSPKDVLLKAKAPDQRERVFQELLVRAVKNDGIANLVDDLQDLPAPLMDWLLYRLLDYALSTPSLKDYLLSPNFLSTHEGKLLGTTNKMLYRLYSEYRKAIETKEQARENELREIGRLIIDHLEKIEINLFGYYELRTNLENIGLERILDRPGGIISKPDFDGNLYELLPSEKDADLYQAITLGMRVKNGAIIRRAYLATKED